MLKLILFFCKTASR